MTIAGICINAVPGDTAVTIPVTVTSFDEIGKFTLTLVFDTARIQYMSSETNPAFPGMTVTYIPPPGNNRGKLVMEWTGESNVSLDDQASIVTLTFQYLTGTGILEWAYTFGSICQYKRYVDGNLFLLNDSPKYQYYINGGISDRDAPETYAPTIADPVPGSMPVPVTVDNFVTIGALTLSLEYDSAVIVYQNSFTKNPAFGSSFQVGVNTNSAGMKVITIQWYGSSVTLADGSVLCTLNFTYPSANCNPTPLTWNENGPSCEYTDAQGDVLIDMPQESYYIDGVVASGLMNIWTGNINSDWNEPGNWNICGVPDSTKEIEIPDVSPQTFPVITENGYCKSVILDTGASLTIGSNAIFTIGNN